MVFFYSFFVAVDVVVMFHALVSHFKQNAVAKLFWMHFDDNCGTETGIPIVHLGDCSAEPSHSLSTECSLKYFIIM